MQCIQREICQTGFPSTIWIAFTGQVRSQRPQEMQVVPTSNGFVE